MAKADFTPETNITISAAKFESFLVKFQATELMFKGMRKLCEDGENLALIDVNAVHIMFDTLHADFINLQFVAEGLIQQQLENDSQEACHA